MALEPSKTNVNYWEVLPDKNIHNPTLKKAWLDLFKKILAEHPKRGEFIDELEFEIEILNIFLQDRLNEVTLEKIIKILTEKAPNGNLDLYLNNPKVIRLDFDDPTDKEYYDYFFTVRLVSLPVKRIYDFLTYHLKKTFKSDGNRFKNFLDYAILKGNGNFLNEDQRNIISNYFNGPGHQTEHTGPTARQSAIILYVNVESKQEKELKPKRKWLEGHAKKLNIGVSSFSKKFFDVQKDFKNSKTDLIDEINSVYPFLNHEAKKQADYLIQRISHSAPKSKKAKRF